MEEEKIWTEAHPQSKVVSLSLLLVCGLFELCILVSNQPDIVHHV